MKNITPTRTILAMLLSLTLFSANFSYAYNAQTEIEKLNQIDNNISAMVGQMILCGFKGQNIEEDPAMVQALEEGKVGSVILFYRNKETVDYNISSPAQVKKLLSDIKNLSPYPLFVSIDQEGGMVQRISSRNGFNDYPSAEKLGQQPIEKTLESSKELAKVLKDLGFNVNFAPVVDVLNPKSQGIAKYERAFHEDPKIVAEYAKAFIDGMTNENIITSLKHFPGHGNATNDTHDGFTDITNTWKEEELLPYQIILNDKENPYIGMVMTAHVYNANFDNKPASLSKEVITNLLREKMGYQGVVITDDMQMGALTKQYPLEDTVLMAIDAGVDILLFGNNLSYDAKLPLKLHEIVMQLLKDGKISEERIKESWARIKQLKIAMLSQ